MIDFFLNIIRLFRMIIELLLFLICTIVSSFLSIGY